MQLWSHQIAIEPHVLTAAVVNAVWADLSKELKLQFTAPYVDFSSRTVSVRVKIVNPRPVAIHGPLTVVLNDIESALSGVRAVNADNGLVVKGAAWNFSMGGAPALMPGAQSDERVFRWVFARAEPRWQQALLRMHFSIRGSEKRHAGGRQLPP